MCIDEKVDESKLGFLYSIGHICGMSDTEIEDLIETTMKTFSENLTDDYDYNE
mgnify:FL=1